jgi:ABC-type bacteriocin/lantibiotic exporter with double-glycine peptidase domain
LLEIARPYRLHLGGMLVISLAATPLALLTPLPLKIVVDSVVARRAQLFAHVQRLSFTYHDARGTADATYRIQYDAQAIQSLAAIESRGHDEHGNQRDGRRNK